MNNAKKILLVGLSSVYMLIYINGAFAADVGSQTEPQLNSPTTTNTQAGSPPQVSSPTPPSATQGSSTVYKSIVNGKVIFSSSPQSSKSEKIEVSVTPPGRNSEEVQRELEEYKKKSDEYRTQHEIKNAEYDKITSEMLKKQDELDTLKRDREALKEPKDGEKSWWVNPNGTSGTRLNEGYFLRQQELDKKMDNLEQDIQKLNTDRRAIF